MHFSETVLRKSVFPLQSQLKNTPGTPWTAFFPKGAACICKAWGSEVFISHTGPIYIEEMAAKTIRAPFPPGALTFLINPRK